MGAPTLLTNIFILWYTTSISVATDERRGLWNPIVFCVVLSDGKQFFWFASIVCCCSRQEPRPQSELWGFCFWRCYRGSQTKVSCEISGTQNPAYAWLDMEQTAWRRRNHVERLRGNLPKSSRNEWGESLWGTGRRGSSMTVILKHRIVQMSMCPVCPILIDRSWH
jgi:hypothetical protein